MSLLSCFSKAICNNFAKKFIFFPSGNVVVRYSCIWEPDYVIRAKTKTPEYDLLNVQIKGYDFAVLESYQSLIHKIAKVMGIKVPRSWPTPCMEYRVKRYRPNSTVSESEYKLNLYERNTQVEDVKGHIMSLFLEAVVTACPPGVKISVHEHSPEIDEDRFIPDYRILEFQEQLDNLGSVSKKKKKK